jgi:hypothetical protein
VADEKLFVRWIVPVESTLAICTSVIPTDCTGCTLGSHVGAGVGAVPPELDVKPPIVTEGSEPSDEPASVDVSGATVAPPEVEAGPGADPCPAARSTAVVVAPWAACLAVEVPEDAEGFGAPVAPGPAPVPAAGAAPDPADPADSEPATAPVFGGLALQALRMTARARSDTVTLAALAANCVIVVHPPECAVAPRPVTASARE